MKKYLKKIQELNRGKQFQIITSCLFLIIAIVVVFLNLTDLYSFSAATLLSIVIVLLISIDVVYILDDLDVFEETKNRLTSIDEQVQEINENMRSDQIKESLSYLDQKMWDIYTLIKDERTTKDVILSRKEIEQDMSLESIWDNATEVNLLAIANTGFLRGNGISKIKDAVNRGMKFKMVSLNPEFSALKEYEESNIISDTSLPVGENVNLYIKNCKNANGKYSNCKKFKENVELRLTTYLLPYSMMIVKKHNHISLIKVDLYGVDINYMERRSFYIFENDVENINFYQQQWEAVWENKEKTTSVDFGKKY